MTLLFEVLMIFHLVRLLFGTSHCCKHAGTQEPARGGAGVLIRKSWKLIGELFLPSGDVT
jgi:hypothetical protein